MQAIVPSFDCSTMFGLFRDRNSPGSRQKFGSMSRFQTRHNQHAVCCFYRRFRINHTQNIRSQTREGAFLQHPPDLAASRFIAVSITAFFTLFKVLLKSSALCGRSLCDLHPGLSLSRAWRQLAHGCFPVREFELSGVTKRHLFRRPRRGRASINLTYFGSNPLLFPCAPSILVGSTDYIA